MGKPKTDLKAILENDAPKQSEVEVIEKPKAPRCPSRQGKTLVSAHINSDAHYQLKLLSLETGASIQQIIIDALNMAFKLHDKPPIA